MARPAWTNDFTVRAGTIYYVSTSGSGSGTFASPIGPSQIYALMGPGVTFIFRAGTYGGVMGQTGAAEVAQRQRDLAVAHQGVGGGIEARVVDAHVHRRQRFAQHQHPHQRCGNGQHDG